VVDANDASRVADRAGDRRRVGTACGHLPEADPDDAAGRGDSPQLRVAEIAQVVAGAFDARMRDEQRSS
jgi:hypothetical protein